MKYREYTDQDILNAVKNVKSVAGLLKELGLKPAGGNYANMKKNLQRLQADTSHWTGQAWSRNERTKNWKDYTRNHRIKKHLISERGHQCERCHLAEWLSKPITIELEHIDGDRTNNEPSNLKLLCPNCHSYTDTWRGRNKK